MKVCYPIMVGCGLLLVAAGLVAYFVIGDVTKKALLDELVIDGVDHKNYQKWTTDYDEDDQAVYFNYYLFNLTNPVEWQAGTAKADFAEVGPFVYRRYVNKTNPEFGDGGNDVSWNPHNEYIFEPTRSVSSDTTTMIFNINPYYLAAVQSAANNEAVFNANLATGSLARVPVATLVGGTGISMAEASTALAIFTGNTAAFIGFSQLVSAYSTAVAQGQTATASAVATRLNATFPGAPNFWTFNAAGKTNAINFISFVNGVGTQTRTSLTGSAGSSGQLMYRRMSAHAHLFGPDTLVAALTSTSRGFITNHTTYDKFGPRYTVKTGKDDESFLGMDHHIQVEGVSTSSAYVHNDGSGPVLPVSARLRSMSAFQDERPDSITAYFIELERLVVFNYQGEEEIEGIKAWDFLANTEPIGAISTDYNVTIQGFAPLQYWARGVPFHLSVPHQRYSAVPFSTAITGMVVNADSQSTYLVLEPTTGVPLEARLAAQNNILVNFTATSYTGFQNVTEKVMMVPLYWSAQTYRIREDSAKTLRRAVVTAVILRRALLGCLVGVGSLLILSGIVLIIKDAVSGGGDLATSSNSAPESDDTSAPKKKKEVESPTRDTDVEPFTPTAPPADGKTVDQN